MASFNNGWTSNNNTSSSQRTTITNFGAFGSRLQNSGQSSLPESSNVRQELTNLYTFETVNPSSERRNSTLHFGVESKEYEGRFEADSSPSMSFNGSNSSLDSFSSSSSYCCRRGSAFDNNGRLDWGKLVEKEFVKEIEKMDEGDVENLAKNVWKNSQTFN